MARQQAFWNLANRRDIGRKVANSNKTERKKKEEEQTARKGEERSKTKGEKGLKLSGPCHLLRTAATDGNVDSPILVDAH